MPFVNVNDPDAAAYASLEQRLLRSQLTKERASGLWTHVTQLVPTAAALATAVANHAGVRVALQGAKFFQARFPINGVVVLPLSVGDDNLRGTLSR
jgi:hypothetical protein